MGALDLTIGGYGGGPGGDSRPLQVMNDAFMDDLAKLAVDRYGLEAVLRADGTWVQNAWTTGMTPASSVKSFNFDQIDRLAYWCSVNGARLHLTLHPRGYGSASGQHREPSGMKPGLVIPHIFNSGKMDGLYYAIQLWMRRYYGANAVIRAGSAVKLENGSTVHMDPSWQGALAGEPWNEQNSIGDAGGLLNWNTPNSLPNWDMLNFRILRETVDAMGDDRAARNGNWKIGAMCVGSIEFAFIEPIQANETVDTRLFADADFAAFHIYQHGNPRTEPGSKLDKDSRHINTCQTSLRPYMTGKGGAACKIWIDEGVSGGDNHWNRGQKFNGVAGVGKATPSLLAGYGPDGRILWEAPIGYPGYTAPGNQLAGQDDQATVNRIFFERADELNAMSPSAGIEAIIPHIGLQIENITQAMATGGGGWDAWHRSRAGARSISVRYIRASWSGTPAKWRSPHWKPECEQVSDYWYATKNATHPGDPPPPPPPPDPHPDTGPPTIMTGGRGITQKDYPTVGSADIPSYDWILNREIDQASDSVKGPMPYLILNNFYNITDPANPPTMPNNAAINHPGALYIQIHCANSDAQVPGQLVYDNTAPNAAGQPGIVQGDADTAFLNGINNILALGKETTICFQHEPENDHIANGYNDKGSAALGFCRAFNRIVANQVAYWAAHGGQPANFKGWIVTLTEGGYDAPSVYGEPAIWYDTLTFPVSYVGCDGYHKETHTTLATFFDLFHNAYNFAVSRSLPLWIGEVGMSDMSSGVKSVWLQELKAQAKLWVPTLKVMIFQVNVPTTNPYYDFAYNGADQAASTKAWRDIHQDSYFRLSTLPPPNGTPPPPPPPPTGIDIFKSGSTLRIVAV